MIRKKTNKTKLAAAGILAMLSCSIHCIAMFAASSAILTPHGEVVYIRQVLDPARGGPTYTNNPYGPYPRIETPAYDAVFLQRLPDGAPMQIMDCRQSIQLGTQLYGIAFDTTGRYLAFTSNERKPTRHSPERHKPFVYDLQTRTLKSLGKDNAIALAWSPFGSRLIFSSQTSNGLGFNLYDADSGKTSQLLSAAQAPKDVQWIDGDKSILYDTDAGIVVEKSLESGREIVRWSHGEIPQYDAYASTYTQARIISNGENAYLFPGSQRHKLKIGMGYLQSPDDALWAPGGKLIAVADSQDLSNIAEDGSQMTPQGTDHFIGIMSSDTWHQVRDVLYWHDSGITPFRYQLISWSGGHRWLLMLDNGEENARNPPSERLLAYSTLTEKTKSIVKIDASIESIDWHSNGFPSEQYAH